jgi:glycine/D-amino acid oxidase-like deaminating enzyme
MLVDRLEPVSAASVAHWDDTADVVVTGYGISGACPAIEAHRRDADALILELSSRGGGTSIISSGIFLSVRRDGVPAGARNRRGHVPLPAGERQPGESYVLLSEQQPQYAFLLDRARAPYSSIL